MSPRWAVLALGVLLAGPTAAQDTAAPAITLPTETPAPAADATPNTRNGREIYQRFRDGLADKQCAADASTRWRKHFSNAPKQLATRNDDVLPLFGYVVDALREAHLPTEYALIPFVESGYKPGARSSLGPAGLWQFIAVTARNHKVPMRPGYDGRLSPVDSTQAAVRYLKTLHGMFAGDWRLAVMAYNAGEYRIFGALKRSGQTARNATPDALPGLSDITYAYVRKLHALSCLMEDADDREEWLRALDRPVPRLEAVTVPDGVASLSAWAKRSNQDAAQLARLNPVFAGGTISRAAGKAPKLLGVAATSTGGVDASPSVATTSAAETPLIEATSAPATTTAPIENVTLADASTADAIETPASNPRRHTIARGDNASTIAKRYGIRVADLLQRNGLTAQNTLRPGKVLQIDAIGAGAGAGP